MMRLSRLRIEGFRAFGQAVEFDLDADAVLILGPNGSGKTSLFDAILWAIVGNVSRISDQDDQMLVSVYSETGGARVSLELESSTGEPVEIIRQFDGEKSHCTVLHENERIRGKSAVNYMCELLWPQSLSTENAVESLTRALTRSSYLQQDLVRQFIQNDDEHERFTAVSELIGTGRIAELQEQLDNERTAWTGATNRRKDELHNLQEELQSVLSRLESLGTMTTTETELEAWWDSWWDTLASLESESTLSHVDRTQISPKALEDAVHWLRERRRSWKHKMRNARRLIEECDAEVLAPDSPDLDVIEAELDEVYDNIDEARVALNDAQAQAAQLRERQTKHQEDHEEFRVLAEVALRHLGNRCPVCAQEYDYDATVARLEDMRSVGEGSDDEAVLDSRTSEVEDAAVRLRELEERKAELENRLHETRQAARDIEIRRRELLEAAEEMGAAADDLVRASEKLRELEAQLESQIEVSNELEERGEELLLRLTRRREDARRAELETERSELRSQVDALEAAIEEREETGEVAVELLERLQEAASDLVTSELKRIDPLLQRVYATIDPHPAFRSVRLVSRFSYRRGRILAQLEDLAFDCRTTEPESVLSSSQLNGLALSVFLALNLGMRTRPLDSIMLDDPLQSMDTVNLLGVVDLLRRTRSHRQLLVSSHDPRFVSLLSRKLRPVSEAERTLIYQFETWTREGPRISKREVELDESSHWIVSQAA